MSIKKLHISTLFSIISLMLINSCTEIIQIDINGSEPQVVVEASIGQGENAKVILTESVNLYTTDVNPAIQNAIVTLTDREGITETLHQSSPGIYVSVNMKGEVGKIYNLRIAIAQEIITSSCKIPNYVPVDSFRVVNSIYPGGGPPILPNQPADFYEVYVTYTDPVAEKNYYRLVLFVNGKPAKNNYIYDDRLTNGNQVKQQLFVYDPEIKSGDSIFVEVQCIDKSVYDFFKSMGNSSMGPGNASSPANPYTNLQGAILGCFNAHTVERWKYFVE